MLFFFLRQVERGLLGIFSAVLLRDMTCFGIGKDLYQYVKMAAFIIPFLTEGLLFGKINTAFVHLIIIIEITAIAYIVSKRNFFGIACNAVCAYALLVVLFMICSVIPIIMSICMFNGLNDLFVKEITFPLFITAAIFLCAYTEKSHMGKVLDDKFVRIFAALICSAVLICVIVSSIFCSRLHSQYLIIFLYLAAAFFFCLYCILLIFSVNEAKTLNRISAEVEDKNTKYIKVSAEREEFIIELHRLRKAVGITADTIKMIFAGGYEIPDEFRENGKAFLRMYDQFTDEEKLRAVEVAVPYSTGIGVVDDFLKECACRAARENIDFSAVNACPINEIVDSGMMPVMNFHRAVVDLMNNAFHSVESSGETRKIMFLTGITQERKYAVDFFDSGNRFSESVIRDLGKRGNTTDGNGQGLADTLKSLRACYASFLIQNLDREKSGYTKVVKIIFDGKGEVRVE